jgi:hypothetical protein
MGHRACYVLVKRAKARAFADQWGAMGVLDLFAGGPAGCLQLAGTLEPVGELLPPHWAEGGLLIDSDEKQALVFGPSPSDFIDGPSPDEAGELAFRGDPAEWLVRIQPHWPGYELRFVDGIESFAAHLQRRRLALEALEPAQAMASSDARRELQGRLDVLLPDRVSAEERFAQLGGSPDDPPPRRTEGARSSLLLLLVFVLVVGPPALVIRLVPPLRHWLRARLERREAIELRRHHEEQLALVADSTGRLQADPRDPVAAFDRGLALLQLDVPGQAEVDFDTCVQALEAGRPAPGSAGPAKVKLESALHNRGLARARLRLGALSEADLTRARELGVNLSLPLKERLRAALWLRLQLFYVIAGAAE